MDTGGTRTLSTSNIPRNHAWLHLWARLGSNQRVCHNARLAFGRVSTRFAGKKREGRLVGSSVSQTLPDCSDGHTKDKHGLTFADSGVAPSSARTSVARVWRNHAAPSQHPGKSGLAAGAEKPCPWYMPGPELHVCILSEGHEGRHVY